MSTPRCSSRALVMIRQRMRHVSANTSGRPSVAPSAVSPQFRVIRYFFIAVPSCQRSRVCISLDSLKKAECGNRIWRIGILVLDKNSQRDTLLTSSAKDLWHPGELNTRGGDRDPGRGPTGQLDTQTSTSPSIKVTRVDFKGHFYLPFLEEQSLKNIFTTNKTAYKITTQLSSCFLIQRHAQLLVRAYNQQEMNRVSTSLLRICQKHVSLAQLACTILS